jgi:hypothetical protein
MRRASACELHPSNLYMAHQWIFLGVFLLFVALGWLWSMSQRRKAVDKACEEIRRQVRREWSTLEHR